MLVGDGWAFIHIPKCGGTALREHLDGIEYGDTMPLGNMYPIRSQWHRIPKKRPSGRVFTVIRHPASWLRSFWCDQTPKRVRAVRHLHKFWSDDLEEFVANVCERSPGFVGKLYSASIAYRDVKVFRLEDGLDKVLAWLGVDGQVSRLNVSHDKPKLSSAAVDRVMRAEPIAMTLLRGAA